MYSFIRTEPFQGLSSLYEIYDSNNTYVTTIVIGYDDMNNIYYFTEYRGTSKRFIQHTDEFCAILYDFSMFFEILEPTDIISSDYMYLTYKDKMPEILLKYLYLYDSSGEVSHERDGDWIIIPDDNILEDLVYCKAVNGTQILLEDYNDCYNNGESLFIDLSEDPSIYNEDGIEGHYLAINDWNEIIRRAESYKIHSC